MLRSLLLLLQLVAVSALGDDFVMVARGLGGGWCRPSCSVRFSFGWFSFFPSF